VKQEWVEHHVEDQFPVNADGDLLLCRPTDGKSISALFDHLVGSYTARDQSIRSQLWEGMPAIEGDYCWQAVVRLMIPNYIYARSAFFNTYLFYAVLLDCMHS
jgi:hypothetical protein